MMAREPSPQPNYHLVRINQPDIKEAPAKRQAEPRLQVLGMWRILHAVNVLQVTRPQRVLGITVQCKTREPKEKPREGTDFSRGHTGSMNSGIMLTHVSRRDAWIKGTTLEFLARCDIGATPKVGPSGEFPQRKRALTAGGQGS